MMHAALSSFTMQSTGSPSVACMGSCRGMTSWRQQCAMDTVSTSAVCIAVEHCLCEPQVRGNLRPSFPTSSMKN
eukprot:9082128-Heterocapsa_arctica.AAC.1